MSTLDRFRMALAEVAPHLEAGEHQGLIHAGVRRPSGEFGAPDRTDRATVAKAYDVADVPQEQRCWFCAIEDGDR